MESANLTDRGKSRTLGILAGTGDLPRQVAAEAQRRGYSVLMIAFHGQTDPQTVEGYSHFWTQLGAAGAILEHLHSAAVRDIVMVGPIRRPGFSALNLDKRARKALMKAGKSVFGDDGLLGGIVHLLEEEEGFRVLGPDHFLARTHPIPEGTLGRHSPDQLAQSDIERGLSVARALGRLDVGQAVVVQQGMVLGVEAIEGTDSLLARIGILKRPGPGGVLVKVAKPQQEIRVDMPTVGPDTVRAVIAAGLRGIALETGRTLLLEPEKTIELADEGGCFIVGIASHED